MDLSIIAGNAAIYLEGLKNTIILVSLALFVGLLLAIPLAVLRSYGWALTQAPIRAFVYFFRGTPLLVQMFLVYYGFGQFELMRESLLWPLFREAYFCALLTFTLNTCAYTTEIFAGAIRSVPHGEIEAARAYGFSSVKLYRCIILPSALRIALPAYSNEVILMLHSTALAFTATVPDLLKIARDINSATYQPFTAFGIAAVLYLIISYVLISLFRKAEKRWLQHIKPSTH